MAKIIKTRTTNLESIISGDCMKQYLLLLLVGGNIDFIHFGRQFDRS